MSFFSALLAVAMLTDLERTAPEDAEVVPDRDFAAESAAATNAVASASGSTVTVTSRKADYDRREGVILFDGEVCAWDPEVVLHSDKMYLFLDGTNQLKRIVVTGDVAITNGLKSGTCERAQYVRAQRRVVMHGEAERPAVLIDDTGKRNMIAGRKITFWIGSEQVEVEDPVVTVEGGVPAGDLLGR